MRRREEMDADGTAVRVEVFDESGRIIRSEGPADGGEGARIIWHFDKTETAVRAETDSDGDGDTEVWFHYTDGRIAYVEEDRNNDGRPDLWEIYDDNEQVRILLKDLDFDGVADLESRPAENDD